jgi:hypothetical protein
MKCWRLSVPVAWARCTARTIPDWDATLRLRSSLRRSLVIFRAGRASSREARAVAALNHPNIVAVYDVGDGYMVSELVDGETLRGTRFGLRKTLDIAAQIAGGLAAAPLQESFIAISNRIMSFSLKTEGRRSLTLAWRESATRRPQPPMKLWRCTQSTAW